MPKKLKKSFNTNSGDQLAQQIKDSAQKIWHAGLGAFARAQDEGGKVFDSLVKQGQEIDKNTRHIAGKALEAAKAQASEAMGKVGGKLDGKWDKLEQVFEDRVHRSLNRIGVLTSKDVEALNKQVANLSATVRNLSAQKTRAAAPKTTASKVKAAAKKTAKSGVKRAAKVVKTVRAKLK